MPTYVIVNAAVTDPDLLAAYRAAAPATFEGHDVTVRVASNDAETIEGEPVGSRVVVLEFPDRAAFQTWYDSPAYQEIIDMRLQSTRGFVLLVEGRS
jgi:uncharacterized protein (DUF1330 family)